MNKWIAGGGLLTLILASVGLQQVLSSTAIRSHPATGQVLPKLDSRLELAPGKVHHLFNGQDLTGWRQVGGGRVHVEDGWLVLENDEERRPGYLVTEQVARNFRASFQCKVATGDSGFFYRSQPDPRTPTTIMGPQVQLNALPEGGLGGIFETQGRGWLARPAAGLSAQLLRDLDAITCELEVRDDHVRVTVNGQVTADFVDDAASRFRQAGFFGLQIHGGGVCRVAWRWLEVQVFD